MAGGGDVGKVQTAAALKLVRLEKVQTQRSLGGNKNEYEGPL